MSVSSRLHALENAVKALNMAVWCPACGAPGDVRVILLERGQELQHCEECGGLLDADRRPVALRVKVISRGSALGQSA